jgi:uncharacterized membrane protein
MPHFQIRIDETLQASVQQAFSVLSDHNGLGRLMGVPVKRIVDGATELNGLGSIRQIGLPVLGIQETVTGFEAQRMIQYRITKGGFPMRNHQGAVFFESAGTGCRVRWEVDYDMPPMLGNAITAVLNKVLRQAVLRVR